MAATKRSFLGRLFRLPRLLAGDAADLVETLVRHWPGSTGYAVRTAYYRRRLKHLGRDVVIDPDVLITGMHYISIHDNVHISRGCTISGGPTANTVSETRRLANGEFGLSEGEVSIGRGAHIAAGCYILGTGGVQIGDFCGLAGGTRILSISNHYASFSDRSRRDIYFTLYAGAEHACYLIGPVVLGDNVGVASNAVLLPGATVCNDSFVTIGSVVHPGVIPPNSIASGNPAAPVRRRFAPPRSSE